MLETIREYRFNLELLYNYLRSLSTRIYEIDYRQLGDLENVDLLDIVDFKHYIDTRFEDLLKSHHLKKHGRVGESSFYLRSELIKFRQSMTFEEFVDQNFALNYNDLNLVGEFGFEPKEQSRPKNKAVQFKEISYKEFEDELSKFRDFNQRAKETADSFEDFAEALDQLNSSLKEEFETNKDAWRRDEHSYTDLKANDMSIDSMRREVTKPFYRLFALMHKRYRVDSRYLNTLSRVKRRDLYDELDRLANQYGLERVNTYFDGSFDLKPFNLTVDNLTSLMDFVTSSDVLDSGLREYAIDKDISKEFVELNEYTTVIWLAIRMFRDFEIALEQFNEKLTKRIKPSKKSANTNKQSETQFDDNLAKQIRDLEYEMSRSFYNLRWHLRSTYSINYDPVKSSKHFDKGLFKDFRADVEDEIERLISKSGFEKRLVFKTNSFRMTPTDLYMFYTMQIQEFVDINLPEYCNDTMFIDSICIEPTEEVIDKVNTLLAEGIMTEEEVESEIQILKDFIDVIRDDIDSFFDFRDELRDLEESLLSWYDSAYSR